jgi:hypothetical protein
MSSIDGKSKAAGTMIAPDAISSAILSKRTNLENLSGINN